MVNKKVVKERGEQRRKIIGKEGRRRGMMRREEKEGTVSDGKYRGRKEK